MSKITNTTEVYREHLRLSHAAGIPAGQLVAPGAIEASEAAGQRELVRNGGQLPTERRGERSEWEALGFVFGDAVEGDPMFQHVTLPDGWTFDASDHSMWSYVLDELGRRRVAVFYKAAFYDRRASASLVRVPTTKAQDDAEAALRKELEGEWGERGVASGAEALAGEPPGAIEVQFPRYVLMDDDHPDYMAPKVLEVRAVIALDGTVLEREERDYREWAR